MRRFQYIAALTFIWAGVMSAAQVPCPVNTAAYYEATFTTLANGCTIGPLVFWGFNATPHGAFPVDLYPLVPDGGARTDADVIITAMSDANGIGCDVTPVSQARPWQAYFSKRDYKLPFQVGCAGLPGPFTGSGFITPDGAAPGQNSVALRNGQITYTGSFSEILIVSTRFGTLNQ